MYYMYKNYIYEYMQIYSTGILKLIFISLKIFSEGHCDIEYLMFQYFVEIKNKLKY